LAGKQARIRQIQDEMGKPGFYENRERANVLINELKALTATVEPIQALLKKVEDLQVLLELARESADTEEVLQELEAESGRAGAALERIETLSLLSEPSDARNCYFAIQAGAGGTESCDWAEMLLRMYLRYFEKAGYEVDETSRREGEGAGIQNIQLYVKGPYASGYLSCEMGVHRLVRISPFDAAKRRHTSFASVDVLPEFDDIQIDIDWDKDVREDVYRSGGAGGQHVNKTSSAIRLTHLGTGVVVACQNERSQHQNRAFARKMLTSKLYRLEESKRNAELAKLYGEKGDIAFGHQIRSYVLYPYQMVKDLRTGVETSDTEGVLDGEIQAFIDAELRRRAAARAQAGKAK
jgi:peptide chain release factor 2